MIKEAVQNETELTEEEIISGIRSGNVQLYREIVRRNNQRLYRIALSYGISDDDADEVMQIAYITAYEKLDQFRGEAKFSTWLTKILINECLMQKRSQKRFSRLNNEMSVTIPAGRHQNPEENYMNEQRKEILEKAVNELPDKYRSVFILKEVEGMSIDEASKVLNISKVNVKVRLHRAKSMLKDFISGMTDLSSLFTFGNDRCDRLNENVMQYVMGKETK
jgi:RNA polymerase sigma-70 factor (ECF subfamily)